MIDRTILELSRSQARVPRAVARPLEGDPEALLFVTFFGDDAEDEARDKLDRLERGVGAHGHGYHTLRAETAAEQDALTKVRKAGLGLLMAAERGRTPARSRSSRTPRSRPSACASTSRGSRRSSTATG